MANLVAPLLADPGVAAVHGRQVPRPGLNPYEERLLLEAFAPRPDGGVAVVFSNSNAAIRRAVLIEHPFDEEAAFGEDLVWARTLPGRWRIAYAQEAAVFHSHPLDLAYWTKRYFQIGLQKRYLQRVHGMDFPERDGVDPGERPGAIQEAAAALAFLRRRGYWRHLLLFPLHFAVRRWSYRRGLREGERRYGRCQARFPAPRAGP
jgi:hypothetical protein